MYTEYWRLERRPFENDADPAFFFLAPEHAEAVQQLAGLFEARGGAGLLTGGYGCGKTTIVRALGERLDLERHRVAYLSHPRFSREELLGEILRQMGEDSAGDRVARVRRLGDLFVRTRAEGGHSVVILDEAQIVSGDGVLEELRALLEFRLDGVFLMSFVLVAQPRIRERILRMPRLDQEILVRCHVHALDLDHTRAYIAFRLATAGSDRLLFSDEAARLVHERSRGMPRRINDLCDLALFVGARKRVDRIDGEFVRRVA